MRSKKWFLLAALPFLGGCYTSERGRMLEDRVDRLSDENARQSEKIKETQTQFTERMEAKIAEVTRVLETLDKATHRSGADVSIQLQKVVQDVAQLRGQVDTFQFKVTELEASVKKLNDEVDRKLLELKGSDAVKAADARKRAEDLPRPSSKREFLAMAEEKSKEDTALGRQLYMDLLKKWPKDSEVAGEAHFGLGETYFTDDKCREALFEYRKVIEEFPKSRSTPTAYLRTSDCLRKLKLPDDARIALQELIQSYPKSEAARTARVKLAELDKGKKKPKK